MKIQLINAPLSNDIIPSTRSGIFPPVNLVALSSYLIEHIQNIEIEILDGDILEFEKISKMINADFVGIGSTIVSYNQALKLAEVAKSKGAKVILGGQHASAIWKYILKNRVAVDYVVVGDGEEALAGIIKGDDEKNIPNIAYRHKGKYIFKGIKTFNLDNAAILNYDIINQ